MHAHGRTDGIWNDSGDPAAALQTQERSEKGTGLPFGRSPKQVNAADRAALAKKRNFDLAFAEEATTRYDDASRGVGLSQ